MVDDGLDPEPVPFDLEEPVVVIERLRGERREHRLDLGGERGRLGALQIDLRRRCRRLADPDRVAVRLDLVVGATGLDALGEVLGIPARPGEFVGLVEQ
jgi:hypothetical protein